MIPARPRRRRGPSGAALLLQEWAQFVRLTERGLEDPVDDCPCCCPVSDSMSARDALEGIVRRGGRRGRQIAVALQPLDERFYRSTVHADPRLLDGSQVTDGRWWRGRLLG